MIDPSNTEELEKLAETLLPLNTLAPEHRSELLATADVRQYRKGKFVFRQGDRDNHAFYLLDGELAMYSDDRLMQTVVGASEPARQALAQLQPRQLSAKAATPVTLLIFDRSALEKLIALEREAEQVQAEEFEVSEIDLEEEDDWMTRMLQSDLFARLPAENLQRMFAVMEAVSVAAGDVVVHQGEPGDYYYIIETGRCIVTRKGSSKAPDLTLAELGPGDSFGEEALVSDTPRNATVTMSTAGDLMRLPKQDFVQLIKAPTLSAVSYEEAQQLVDDGAVWLDVRFREETRAVPLEGSVNMPLGMLRMHSRDLDTDKRYVVVCDTGDRSSVGAFLLTQAGLDAVFIDGGLAKTPLMPEPAKPPTPPKAESPPPPAQKPVAEPPVAEPSKSKPTTATTAPKPVVEHDEVKKPQPPPADTERAPREGADTAVEAITRQLEKANQDRLATEKARKQVVSAYKRLKQDKEAADAQLNELTQRAREHELRAESQATRHSAEMAELNRAKDEAEKRLEETRGKWEAAAAKAKSQEAELQQAKAAAEQAKQAAETLASEKLSQQAERLTAETERAVAAEQQAGLLGEKLAEAERSAAAATKTSQDLRAQVEALDKALSDAKDESATAAVRHQQETAELDRLKQAAEAQLSEERRKSEMLEANLRQAQDAQVADQRAKEQAMLQQELAEERRERGLEGDKHARELATLKKALEDAEKAWESERAASQRSLSELQEQMDGMRKGADHTAAEHEAQVQVLSQRLEAEYEEKVAVQRKEFEQDGERQRTGFEAALGEKDEEIQRLTKAKAAAETALQEAVEELDRSTQRFEAAQEEMRARQAADLTAEREKLKAELARVEEIMANARQAREEAETMRREAAEYSERIRSEQARPKEAFIPEEDLILDLPEEETPTPHTPEPKVVPEEEVMLDLSLEEEPDIEMPQLAPAPGTAVRETSAEPEVPLIEFPEEEKVEDEKPKPLEETDIRQRVMTRDQIEALRKKAQALKRLREQQQAAKNPFL